MNENQSTEQPQSLGGKARALKLTPEERSAIAKSAAESRWEKAAQETGEVRMPKATHPGTLKIGNAEIPCAVLENGTRVITQRGMFVALGMNKNPTKGQTSSIDNRPAFISANNLKPFISEDLSRSWTPIPFRLPKGSGGYKGNIAFGYDAKILPLVCEAYLDAKETNKLMPNQKHIAVAAKILHRGFALVGITALIDEATGYQEVRDRQALQEVLRHYIDGKLYEWALTFPTEFFKGIFRLKGWKWNEGKMPGVVGRYVNDLVYSRLTPGLLDELKRLNPPTEKGYKRFHNHRFLTRDIGHPDLRRLVHQEMGMMDAFEDGEWNRFKARVDEKYPKFGATMMLPLGA